MPLYGHELSEQIDPFQAGLGFACHLAGYDFPGRNALLRIQKPAAAGGPHRPGDAGRAPLAAGRLPDPGQGKTDRRGDQRHALADVGQADCDGLRRGRVCQARHRVGNRHPRPREPAKVDAIPFYERPKAGAKR